MKTNLKSLLFSVLAICSTSFFQTHAAAHEGFYMGARLGLTYADAKVSGSSYDDTNDITELYSQKPKQNGFIFGGLIGYDWLFHESLIIGLDVNVNYNNMNNTKTKENIHDNLTILNTITKRFSFTTSLKIGGCIANNLILYGKIGATLGWFRLYSHTSIANDFKAASAISKRLWGVRPALGLEYQYNDNLSFTLEASKEIYNNRFTQTYQYTTKNDDIFNNATSVKQPSYTAVMVGINYNF